MATGRHFRVGSRGSALALRQTEEVLDRLRERFPEHSFSIEIISTRGDEDTTTPLSQLAEPGKGIFATAIEMALLDGRIDMAVHSLKDLPTALGPGLALAAIPVREDVRDVLISRDNLPLADLPAGSRIGTSSLRRTAQLLAFRSDFVVLPVRGNVETRLRKGLDGFEGLDAVVLAAAGLNRLGLEERITEYLSTSICLPAIGQGALAVETRTNDEEALELTASIDNKVFHAMADAERSFGHRLSAGCALPIAGLAEVQGDILSLDGMVALPDGSKTLRGHLSGARGDPEGIGLRLADQLLESGAADLVTR
jgi:hydroxymethylbilane synthase